jgi:hypothetical protein
MKAKRKYMQPPRIDERAAVFSSFADCTRWNTSCCGIEPSIIVIHAATNHRTSFSSGFGRRWNLSFCAACAITASAPPGTMPLTAQPM